MINARRLSFVDFGASGLRRIKEGCDAPLPEGSNELTRLALMGNSLFGAYLVTLARSLRLHR
jgi:hypothetical protein